MKPNIFMSYSRCEVGFVDQLTGQSGFKIPANPAGARGHLTPFALLLHVPTATSRETLNHTPEV